MVMFGFLLKVVLLACIGSKYGSCFKVSKKDSWPGKVVKTETLTPQPPERHQQEHHVDEHPHHLHLHDPVVLDTSMVRLVDQIFVDGDKDYDYEDNSLDEEAVYRANSMGRGKYQFLISDPADPAPHSHRTGKPSSFTTTKTVSNGKVEFVSHQNPHTHPKKTEFVSTSVDATVKTKVQGEKISKDNKMKNKADMNKMIKDVVRADTDAKLDEAIESIHSFMNADVFKPLAEQPAAAPSSRGSARSSVPNNEEDEEALLLGDRSQEPVIYTYTSGHHGRHARSVGEDDQELVEAMESLEKLAKTASSVGSPKYSKLKQQDDYILRQVKESYDYLNKASVEVLDDSYDAFKKLEKSKSLLKSLVHSIKMQEIEAIVNKIGSSKKSKSKRSAESERQRSKKLVARGFNSKEYNWLSNEFHLSRKEVDDVQNLSEEEFQIFSKSLMKRGDVASAESGYSAEDLVQVFKSARQLVPAELEAAAHGIVEVGKHLGGRAR